MKISELIYVCITQACRRKHLRYRIRIQIAARGIGQDGGHTCMRVYIKLAERIPVKSQIDFDIIRRYGGRTRVRMIDQV